jgi:hypothetical protein
MKALTITRKVGDELSYCLAERPLLLRSEARSQSGQNDARTSRVGIRWLRARIQCRQEILVRLIACDTTCCAIVVCLALLRLPLARPVPRLLGIYATALISPSMIAAPSIAPSGRRSTSW